MPSISRKCLACGRVQKTYHEKSWDYEEVTVCPECNGALVDRYHVAKYLNKDNKQPLLTIELENEAAVPKVFYKGKEITAIVQVDFDWCTRSCEPLSGGMKLNIEHSDKKVKYPNVRQIAHKAGKFAFDNE